MAWWAVSKGSDLGGYSGGTSVAYGSELTMMPIMKTIGVMCLHVVSIIAPSSSLAKRARWRIATAGALAAFARGDLTRAEERFQRSLTEAKALGPLDRRVGMSLNNQAMIHQAQGKTVAAQVARELVLKNFEEECRSRRRPFISSDLYWARLNLARMLREQNRYDDADRLLQQELEEHRNILLFPPSETCQLFLERAEVARDQGQLVDAELRAKAALGGLELQLGFEHPDLAPAIDFLASLYQSQARTAEAQTLRERARVLRARIGSVTTSNSEQSSDDDSGFYDAMGRYSEPKAQCEHALAIAVRSLGPKHPDVAPYREMAAKYYVSRFKYGAWKFDEAVVLGKQALAAREKSLGPDHPLVADCLHLLGDIYSKHSESRRYPELYKRALDIRERTLGPDHPDVAKSLHEVKDVTFSNLPTIADDGSQRESGQITMMTRALAIQEKALGPDHPAVADTLDSLSGLYKLNDNYDLEQQTLERMMLIREKTSEPGDPRHFRALLNAAKFYSREKNDVTRATAYYERLLEILERTVGREHPDVAAVLNDLAEMNRVAGDLASAESFAVQAVEIRKELGDPFPLDYLARNEVLEGLYQLAQIYIDGGKLDEAEGLLRQVIAAEDPAVQPGKQHVRGALEHLADIYFLQGRFAEARSAYERLMEVWRNTTWIGLLPPGVAKKLARLAAICHADGDHANAERLYRHALGIWVKGMSSKDSIRIRRLGPFGIGGLQTILIPLFDTGGRDVEPEPLSDPSLARIADAADPERSDAIMTVSKLANLLGETGRAQEAEQLETKVRALQTKRNRGID